MKIPKARQLPSGAWFCRVRIDGQDVFALRGRYGRVACAAHPAILLPEQAHAAVRLRNGFDLAGRPVGGTVVDTDHLDVAVV